MAFTFSAADRAGVILTNLQAVNPATLQNDRDRAALAYAIAVLTTLPANFGVIVSADNDDVSRMNVSIKHQAFGNYAT